MGELSEIFDRICSSGRVIVSQQRDEPDLTREENHRVLQQLFEENPTNFLYRFESILSDEDLKRHFHPENDFLRNLLKTNRNKTRANRRFNYMEKLLASGTYFSEESMKERSPLLFQQMIGESRTPVAKTAQGVLTDFFMEHLESINHRERVENELLQQDEEEDEDEEDEDEDERNFHRQEFLAIHKEKFLNGEDSNIDYETIDNDENLDEISIRDRDEEEKYFDDDL